MDVSGAEGTGNKGTRPAPPPGYPTMDQQQQPQQPPQKNRCFPRTVTRGEKGLIEGCLAALCCCWICEECCL